MNPIQSILVHVDAGAGCAARLKVARMLGDQFGAGVTALYAVTPVYVELVAQLPAADVAAALRAIDEERRAGAQRLVASVCAGPGAHLEWREVREAPLYSFARHGLYADLLVLGQDERDALGVSSDFVQSVVIDSGKPALVVPYIGVSKPSFDTVFVAWKETPQAAHAVTAALPLLSAASAVHVGLEAGIAEGPRALLERFLQRHGVQARYHTLSSETSKAGDMMLSMAADLNAELMVMGCYGHSRAREFVLGGASRTVLHTMTLPVLMAH